MAITPGIDVSHHQLQIDWPSVAADGYKFAVVRATMGAGGLDNRFILNWDGAKRAGLLVSAYHLLRPEHPSQAQMDHFLRTLGERKADLPLVLDVELDGGQPYAPSPVPPKSPDEIAESVRSAVKYLIDRGFRRPIIYTARWFWNRRVAPSEEWKKFDLWIANYNVSEPTLPAPWEDWKFWQYTERGKVAGVPVDCDLNYFNGSYDALIAYSGVPAREVDPPAPTTARVITQTLNIRSGPDTTFSTIGALRNGNSVPILSLDGRDVWAKIGEDRWVAVSFRGDHYLEVIPSNPGDPRGLRLKVLVNTLNVRSGPNMNYADVGDVLRDQELTARAIAGDHVWIEFEAGKWVAYTAGGKQFMELA